MNVKKTKPNFFQSTLINSVAGSLCIIILFFRTLNFQAIIGFILLTGILFLYTIITSQFFKRRLIEYELSQNITGLINHKLSVPTYLYGLILIMIIVLKIPLTPSQLGLVSVIVVAAIGVFFLRELKREGFHYYRSLTSAYMLFTVLNILPVLVTSKLIWDSSPCVNNAC